MSSRRMQFAVASTLFFTLPYVAWGWGHRAHSVIDQAAVETLPADGPVFLKKYEDWIEASAIVPDTWRGQNTPFLKIEEDPNHG